MVLGGPCAWIFPLQGFRCGFFYICIVAGDPIIKMEKVSEAANCFNLATFLCLSHVVCPKPGPGFPSASKYVAVFKSFEEIAVCCIDID